jgi:putative Ca2+/H+ antiporter (TMEM165/GDT1 family)
MNQSFARKILRIIGGLIFYLVGAVLIWRSDKKQRLGGIV